MFAHLTFSRSFATTNYAELDDANNLVFDIGYCLIFFLFPLFGLLADVKVGRYTSIITGVYLTFLSWMVAGMAFITITFSH